MALFWITSNIQIRQINIQFFFIYNKNIEIYEFFDISFALSMSIWRDKLMSCSIVLEMKWSTCISSIQYISLNLHPRRNYSLREFPWQSRFIMFCSALIWLNILTLFFFTFESCRQDMDSNLNLGYLCTCMNIKCQDTNVWKNKYCLCLKPTFWNTSDCFQLNSQF